MKTFHVLVVVVLIFLFLPVLAFGQNLRIQTCSRGNVATIQPNANAFIGGIISLNKPGTGTYGCGEPYGGRMYFLCVIIFLPGAVDHSYDKNGFNVLSYSSDLYVFITKAC